jgi:predicted DNA-binding transcriptional regulator AlpA
MSEFKISNMPDPETAQQLVTLAGWIQEFAEEHACEEYAVITLLDVLRSLASKAYRTTTVPTPGNDVYTVPDRLLNLAEVKRLTGLRSTNSLLAATGFPAAIKVGKRGVGYSQNAVKRWLRSRLEAGDQTFSPNGVAANGIDPRAGHL